MLNDRFKDIRLSQAEHPNGIQIDLKHRPRARSDISSLPALACYGIIYSIENLISI